MEEIDLNDEWIIEKEDPLLPRDAIWLKDDKLFNVDVIRILSSQGEEIRAPSTNIVSSDIKRKHDDFSNKY